VLYRSWHTKLRRIKGVPEICSRCGRDRTERRIEWALKLEYHVFGEGVWVEDPDAYEALCRGCHVVQDVPKEIRLAAARAAVTHEELVERWKRIGAARGAQIHVETAEQRAHRMRGWLNHHTAESRRAAGSKGGKAGGRKGGLATSSIRRRCDECSVTTTPGNIVRHQRASGHEGWTQVA